MKLNEFFIQEQLEQPEQIHSVLTTAQEHGASSPAEFLSPTALERYRSIAREVRDTGCTIEGQQKGRTSEDSH